MYHEKEPFEQQHDKTNKMACVPNKDSDLSLRWAHSHFVGFVMGWLILLDRSECSVSFTGELAVCEKFSK